MAEAFQRRGWNYRFVLAHAARISNTRTNGRRKNFRLVCIPLGVTALPFNQHFAYRELQSKCPFFKASVYCFHIFTSLSVPNRGRSIPYAFFFRTIPSFSFRNRERFLLSGWRFHFIFRSKQRENNTVRILFSYNPLFFVPQSGTLSLIGLAFSLHLPFQTEGEQYRTHLFSVQSPLFRSAIRNAFSYPVGVFTSLSVPNRGRTIPYAFFFSYNPRFFVPQSGTLSLIGLAFSLHLPFRTEGEVYRTHSFFRTTPAFSFRNRECFLLSCWHFHFTFRSE